MLAIQRNDWNAQKMVWTVGKSIESKWPWNRTTSSLVKTGLLRKLLEQLLANQNSQYSRRLQLRISGVPISENEKKRSPMTWKVVCRA